MIMCSQQRIGPPDDECFIFQRAELLKAPMLGGWTEATCWVFESDNGQWLIAMPLPAGDILSFRAASAEELDEARKTFLQRWAHDRAVTDVGRLSNAAYEAESASTTAGGEAVVAGS